MSVSAELSSEVAVALFEMKGVVSPRHSEEVLALLRSNLRTLSAEERGHRRARLTAGRTPRQTLRLDPSAD